MSGQHVVLTWLIGKWGKSLIYEPQFQKKQQGAKQQVLLTAQLTILSSCHEIKDEGMNTFNLNVQLGYYHFHFGK